MAEKDPARKLRGTPIAIPAWWLLALREEFARYKKRVEREVGFSFQRLADDLTAASGRSLHGEPFSWDRKTVERFIDNEVTTRELAGAFMALWRDLPRFEFVARSEAEATALSRASRPYDSNPESDISQSGKLKRKAELVHLREGTEQRASDQTEQLKSENEVAERRAGSGRAGRLGRGRSTSS